MDMEEQVYNETSRLLPSGSSRANSMGVSVTDVAVYTAVERYRF
jgi:hypothetical protein